MKIAIISLLPDAGHMTSLLRIGEMLKIKGADVAFFGPEENAKIAHQKNIFHYPLKIERPENHINKLARYSWASRFWQEIILSKWFYINYYEKTIYLGLKHEDHLTRLVREFNADAILCDSHLYPSTYEAVARKCNIPIIFNIAPGSYVDFQREDHPSGIFSTPYKRSTIKFLRKIFGKGYTICSKLLFSEKFKRDSTISDHINTYWKSHLKVDLAKQKKITVSSGIGFLERQYLENKIQMPSFVFQVSSLEYNPTNSLEMNLSEWIESDARPIIYVGFGTMVKGAIPFTKNIIDAARSLGMRILLSHPCKPFDDWQNDTTIRWETWVSQVDILSREEVKIFISHGGSGAMQEAVWFGKPIICMPFLWDQFYNAWVIQNLCGIPPLDKRSISTKKIKNHIKLGLEKGDLFKKYSAELQVNEGSGELFQKISEFLYEPL